MRRRQFMTLVGGVAVAPLSMARAQPAGRLRRVGILMSTAETDPEEASAVAAFVQSLGNLGWVAGRNLEIVDRWGCRRC
jgi:putative ABC transport system substrate-binding protein